MEKNFVSEYQSTCFYVNLTARQYGVCINIKDIDKREEIMNWFYNDEMNKRSIEEWKKEWKTEVGVN